MDNVQMTQIVNTNQADPTIQQLLLSSDSVS